jgi:hypothetical protein
MPDAACWMLDIRRSCFVIASAGERAPPTIALRWPVVGSRLFYP